MEAWLQRAQETLPLHLFSNNPSRSRIGAVAEQLGVNYTTSAGKPRRGPLRRVLSELQLPAAQVAIVGDRVFTDCPRRQPPWAVHGAGETGESRWSALPLRPLAEILR